MLNVMRMKMRIVQVIVRFHVLQIVAISVGVVSVAIGIGIPIFYENQIDNAVSLSYLIFVFFIKN